jgi:hypothetical protein
MLEGMLALGLCLGLGLGTLQAQSAPPQKPQDNPFPGDAPQAPKTPAQTQPAPQNTGQPNKGQSSTGQPGSDAKPDATAPKSKSDNPFPGEDPDAPIIPADPAGTPAAPGAGAGHGANSGSGADAAGGGQRGADPDGDPVRSPDAAGNYRSDDGFSSSRSGLSAVPSGDDSDEQASKAARGKTKKQLIKEDVDVGGFYLDKKNWKAAQGRFASAFALDSENPDSVWGLAEAERHLQMYAEAEEHYKLFLAYEPDGRRGREAKKALDEVEAARTATGKKAAPAGNSPN